MLSYRLVKMIGNGAFGSVFLIKTNNNKNYAMKRISTYNMRTKDKELLLNEIKLLKYCKSPYIINFIGCKSNTTSIEIITKFARYGDFHHIIKRQKKKFIENNIWSYFIQTCLGVKYLHNNNIIHRDIKCANIFLDREDHIYIGDFGISKVLNNCDQLSNTNIGTPLYMCPNIVKKEEYSKEVDIWGLGCFLFELITFSPPFLANNLKNLNHKILNTNFSKNINLYTSFYSPDLINLVNKIMKINNRPTIHELLKIKEVDTRKYLIPYLLNVSVNIRDIKEKFTNTYVYYNWFTICKDLNKI
jgi:NIMA (never in mitosis gene a)-related kinase 1/4/5